MAERVRAILFADNQVILIKRVKPNKPIYWVAPGGGVEPNETHHQALERELYEELGAQIEINQQVLVVTQMGVYQYFYQCNLRQMNLDQRSGPEFDDPARGDYVVQLLPLEDDSLSKLNILPWALKNYLVKLSK